MKRTTSERVSSAWAVIPRWAQWVGAAGILLSAVAFVSRAALSAYSSYNTIHWSAAQDTSQNETLARLIILQATNRDSLIERIHKLEKAICPRVTLAEKRLLELSCP